MKVKTVDQRRHSGTINTLQDYNFVISAGYNTIMGLNSPLFPWTTMHCAAIAPLTDIVHGAPVSRGTAGMRPSPCREPSDAWLDESADLIELIAEAEYSGTIVASRLPKDPLGSGAFTRLEGLRVFHAGFAETETLNSGDDLMDGYAGRAESMEPSGSDGNFVNVTIRRNRVAGGRRIDFEYRPAPSSLQADPSVLMTGGMQVSEVWFFRWAA